MTGFWTAKRVAELKRRWKKNERASVIGREFGCSRNAILGKLHRLGLLGNVTSADLRRRRTEANFAFWNSPEGAIRKAQQSARSRYMLAGWRAQGRNVARL
jgi:hypothetical protein